MKNKKILKLMMMKTKKFKRIIYLKIATLLKKNNLKLKIKKWNPIIIKSKIILIKNR